MDGRYTLPFRVERSANGHPLYHLSAPKCTDEIAHHFTIGYPEAPPSRCRLLAISANCSAVTSSPKVRVAIRISRLACDSGDEKICRQKGRWCPADSFDGIYRSYSRDDDVGLNLAQPMPSEAGVDLLSEKSLDDHSVDSQPALERPRPVGRHRTGQPIDMLHHDDELADYDPHYGKSYGGHLARFDRLHHGVERLYSRSQLAMLKHAVDIDPEGIGHLVVRTSPNGLKPVTGLLQGDAV